MLKSKRLLPTYNDGVLTVYAEKAKEVDFGAKVNVDAVEDMDVVVKLAYREASCREQDFDFAERMSFNLSAKLVTHNRPEVRSNHKAVIGDQLYDIEHIDRAKREMYVYLGGGRTIGGNA